MNSVTSTLILISLIAHVVLAAYALIRRKQVRIAVGWLLLPVLLSLFVTFALLNNLQAVAPLAQAAAVIAYGALVIRDMTDRVPRIWLGIGGLWLALLIVTGSFNLTESWLVAALTVNPSAPAIVMAGGLFVTSLFLLGLAFYAFYIARLPEIANRALFWIVNSAVYLISVVFLGTGMSALALPGAYVLLFGSAGAVYAQNSFRVVDIRREFGTAARILILLFITATIIFSALLITEALEPPRTVATLVLVAFMAALLYLPIRQLADDLIRLVLRASLTNGAEITRRYTQQITNAVELNSLADAATRALNGLLRVRRSALILVNDTGETAAELTLLPSDRPLRGTLAKDAAIYHHFAVEVASLSQFDLEFDPRFKSLPSVAFFRETGLSAYAPILIENSLIGILACGTKLNDAPFTPRDFELLATMASQTGTVLRNARLVADLRTLNQGMQSLNSSLEGAKDQMEKLDAVKTDFVTIASHELRTPLAQVRGYTDIMDALNEAGTLEQERMTGLVANLRKATERMEELISAMLDVSQLDVDAMDLHFAQTSLESVMRMAIEPLTDAIKQRKLTLAARGLRGLPALQADMQRLVQAFRNVVVNAIKFTPDGGKIDISATLQPAERPGDKDHVLITIKDTGVGIDKENLELIFRKFYRAYDPGLHSTGTYKFLGAGPGLGLTIAQGVIAGHGGEIWAESAGHNMQTCPGSTFFIRLPLTPPDNARRVMPFEMPEPISKEPTVARP